MSLAPHVARLARSGGAVDDSAAGRRHRARSRRRGAPWLLSGPAIFFLVAFHLLPVAAGTLYAFTNWSGGPSAHFTGLANFRNIFTDPSLRGALLHTLELAGSFVVLANAIGLALATGLNRAVKSRNLLRALFFAPSALSPLAVGFVWQYILTTNGGLNQFLGDIGLASWQRPWLGDPAVALWAILLVMLWQLSGLSMVIYLAGLQGVPDELYEAAAMDGASHWQRFRRVTFPLLGPSITISSMLTLVTGLRVFDQIEALTGGGPVDATQTLATEVYQQTFVYGFFGQGAALAVVLTVIIAIFAFVQLAVLVRRERRMS